MKLLLIDLGPRRMLTPVSDVDRILLRPWLTQLDSAPHWLSGFLNVQGSSMAVIDLAALLGLPALGVQLYSHLLVLSSSQPPVALEVARVLEILDIPPESLSPLDPSDSFQGLAAGLFWYQQEAIPVLVPRLLLSRAEREKVEYWASVQSDREQSLSP